MEHYFGTLTLLLLVVMVIIRVLLMRRHGVDAMLFGRLDRKDFLIPPFALFYFYQVFARTFDWPTVSNQQFFDPFSISWIGVLLCCIGLILFLLSIISLGSSFRVGIDADNPDKLVTKGVFAITRNPIYVSFWFILLGQFLLFPNWILLIYIVGATWIFHRQVLLEEAFLEKHYGQEYLEYCARVRRYV